MPLYKRLIKSFQEDVFKRAVFLNYKRIIFDNKLDGLSVYISYRHNKKFLKFTIKELDEYTPDWILAKYSLIYDTDKRKNI